MFVMKSLPFGFDFQHRGLDFLTDAEDFRHALHAAVIEFADVNQAFDTLFEFHERAEIGRAGDAARHRATNGVFFRRGVPRVRVFGEPTLDALGVPAAERGRRDEDVAPNLDTIRDRLTVLG